jgi:hypothetical protein
VGARFEGPVDEIENGFPTGAEGNFVKFDEWWLGIQSVEQVRCVLGAGLQGR